MTAAHQKAIVINQWWAGIWASLIASAVIGGVAYAWQNNAENAEIKTKVAAIERADLPNRIRAVEVKIDEVNRSQQRLEGVQERMDNKIDRLLEKTIQTR